MSGQDGEGSAEIGLHCSSEAFTRLDGAGIDLPFRASFKSEASVMQFVRFNAYTFCGMSLF